MFAEHQILTRMTAPSDLTAETTPSRAVVVSDACSAGRVLRLTLKRKWFDMIASGEKKEEYRDPGQWIKSRVNDLKEYDAVEFRNGYQPNAPTVLVEYLGFRFGAGKIGWGADPRKNYLVILLGRIISSQND